MSATRRLGIRRLRIAAVLACIVPTFAAGVSTASAEAPHWQIVTSAVPTNLHPGGTGRVAVFVNNHGDAPTSGETVIAVDLPKELKIKPGGVAGFDHLGASVMTCEAKPAGEGEEAICRSSTVLQPGRGFRMAMEVSVQPTGQSTASDKVSVSGGGAAAAATEETVNISSSEAPFGIEKYSQEAEEEGGEPDNRAGSHPFQLSTNLTINSKPNETPSQLPKNLEFELPAGLIGNPLTGPQCSTVDFFAIEEKSVNRCPSNTAVGFSELTIFEPTAFQKGAGTVRVPVFLLEPGVGEPARLGFVADNVPVVIDTAVRTGKDYGVTAASREASELAGVLGARVVVWGVPGDHRHDNARGFACLNDEPLHEGLNGKACKAQITEREEEEKKLREEGKPVPEPAPFLTMPTSCGTPLTAPAKGESWQGATFSGVQDEISQTLTCEPLAFEPSIEVKPETTFASTPTGLEVKVKMPQNETATGLAESAVKSTTVTLPKGLELNPAAATGLGACSAIEIGLAEGSEAEQIQNDHFTSGPELFPENGEKTLCNLSENSKLGTVEIISPDLKHPVKGYVYLAEEDTAPFKSPLVVYIVGEEPESRVLVKLAGTVEPNEETGQITSTFANTPQVPFNELKLKFFGGEEHGAGRASVTTPETCGSYTTTTSFVPWSNPAAPATPSAPPFTIGSGVGGGSCPPGGVQSFAPGFSAGVTNPAELRAGGFMTSFTVGIERPDGQQPLTGVAIHLPPGIAAVLASVTPCPEPPIGQEWSCGESSLIGHAKSYSGLGNEPVSLTGNVFLTSGYDGAPFGLLVQTRAKAGPFDLGNVNVRQRINVDPTTAAVTITSDPGPRGEGIPTRLKGVPVQLKGLNVVVDRPNFQFNPTNCSQKKITGTLSGANGGSENVETNYQIPPASCAALPFAPKLVASTSSTASKVNGVTFDVNVESAGIGQANIEKVFLTLPVALPSRLTTIQKACPDSTFEANPATCNEGALIGHATIHTPVLKNPLSGPAYLVSHGGAAFPDVEFVLQGEGIEVILDGKTDIKKGITYSRFESAPDAPFTKFETELPEGPHSALTAYTPATPFNLCTSKLEMPTEITGQNGAVIKEITHIGVKGKCTGVLHNKETKLQACERAAHKKYKGRKQKKKLQKALKVCKKKYGPHKKSKGKKHH